ncbi:MAG: HD domain-containing protein [Lachnospiraceae bacterium]|nr:HD domain-containing protein [Lachnospiraceae bacterium]
MSSSQQINIVDVICRSFWHINPLLINHGQRVSYILMKMLADTTYYTKQEKLDIFMLGLLHDIGAYKEEEIDSMLSFDAEDSAESSMEHSVFGYLLFQQFSPLSQYADVILYHHDCNAQYYPVPIGNYHRDIARLIYLADRIDIFCLLKDSDNLDTFLDQYDGTVFSSSDIRWFRQANEKYHILDHIHSGDYQQEVQDYTHEYIILSESQIHDYLMTFIFSVDFRNEYTALHTSYALHLSENFVNTLHLSSAPWQTIQLAVLLHNIGKISIFSPLKSTADYDHYLTELYQGSTLTVTKEILTDAVDPQIINIIEESSLLLKYWSNNTPISFTPLPASEIVALSYLSSNILTQELDASLLCHEKLMDFLKMKYHNCKMDNIILLALGRHFPEIIKKTQTSCRSISQIYQHMEEENHHLNTILRHYNHYNGKYHHLV